MKKIKKQNRYEAILDWVSLDLVNAYEQNLQMEVRLEEEATLLATAEKTADVFRRLAMHSSWGVILITIIMATGYKMPSYTPYYAGILCFFVLTGIVGILFFRQAKKDCSKHTKAFLDFDKVWEMIDPINDDDELIAWRPNGIMQKLTKEGILNNIKKMAKRVRLYEALIGFLMRNKFADASDVGKAQAELKTAQKTLTEAKGNLCLFDIDDPEDVEKDGSDQTTPPTAT